MKTTIDQLEMLLTCWEDTCFLQHKLSLLRDKLTGFTAVQGKPIPMLQPFLTHGSYRKDLLAGIGVVEAMKKYLPTTVHEYEHGYLTPLGGVPIELSCWNRFSRRVFHLDESLQTLLSLTSLQGFTWSDIKLPFESFGLSLDKPIFDEKGGAYDFILISQIPTTRSPGLFVRLICTDIAKHRPVTWVERGNLNRAISIDIKKIQDIKKVLDHHNYVGERLYGMGDLTLARPYNLPLDLLNNIEFENEQGITEAYWRWIDDMGIPREKNKQVLGTFIAAIRVTAGFCLYLAGLPTTTKLIEPRGRTGKGPPKLPSGREPISSESDVCVVRSVYQLTPHERKIIAEHGERSLLELEPKWVRGYHRRPRGFGHDPTAPKSKWVRPYVRGWDYKKEGELFGGAAQIWKTE